MDSESMRAHLKRAWQTRGWTLQSKKRRAKADAYATRRQGSRTEERYLAPLDDLAALLDAVAALPNSDVLVGQRAAQSQPMQANESDPERLSLVSEWLELGRLMSHRRLVLVPCLLDPGLPAWAHFASTTATPTRSCVIRRARVYDGLLKEAGLVQEPGEGRASTETWRHQA